MKGTGLVGARAVTEEEGQAFENVAGAIVAALVACGYRAVDLRRILDDLDCTELMDKATLDRLPGVGPVRGFRARHSRERSVPKRRRPQPEVRFSSSR